MSIATKFEYLGETKEQIREGLNKLGGNISTSDTFRSYADKIEEIYDSMPKVEESDVESATLEGTIEGGLQIDLKGNTSQTGTPTPSTPISVNTCSGDNDIIINGKNLIPNSQLTQTINGVTLTNNNNGTYSLSGTATAQAIFKINPLITELPLVNGETYTYSSNKSLPSGLTTRLEIYNGTTWKRAFINDLNNTTQYRTGTLDTTGADIVRQSIIVASGTTINIENLGLMLEKGSSMTTFEPYQSQTYEVDLGTLELCKIGDYQDYFTKNSTGQWCKYNAIGKYIFTGNEANISLQNNGKRIYIGTKESSIPDALHTPNVNITYGMYCNKLEEKTAGQTWGGTQGISYDYNRGENTGNFDISINGISTLEAYRTAIAGIILYYILETSYLSLIEDNNLIEQLDNIQNAMSYEGQTNIIQTNNDLPFILDVKAILDWRS